MRNKKIILYLGVLCLLYACSKKITPPNTGTKSTTDIHFIEGVLLTDIVDMAKRQDKPVFMYMHASWCLPCQIMEEEVYTIKPTYDFINENFISYRVDAEKANGPDLKVLFNVDQLPGLLFLDHRGRVLEEKQGALSNSDLIQLATSALEKGSLACWN